MKDKVILSAKFNPKVRNYWLLSGAIVFTVTIIGIPLLLLWIPIGLWATGRYLNSFECVLTERSLKVSRGIFNRMEQTVPLDKITDLGLVQGPIMRYLDLEAISVETAGQSAVGALVRLTGIENAREFRDRVLEQRDIVVGKTESSQIKEVTPSIPGDVHSVLVEIRDTLTRIEASLSTSARDE